jgi:hypothetical protein
LVRSSVEDAIAKAVNAVLGHFKEDLLPEASASQGALQAAVAVGADGQDPPDAGIQRRLGLAAQLESYVKQAAPC